MFTILRLIRIRTIAFTVLCMYAIRFGVVLPILDLNGFSLQMANWAFALLVVAVCCLISAAYVINDYFDTKSDSISGVKRVLVGKSVSRRMAISLHTILNIIAVGIAFYLGNAVGIWKIGILFLLVSAILWSYSSIYKKFFIVGNVLVGVLAALIPVSVMIYEIPLLHMAYAETLIETDTNFIYLFYWIFGFSWFIFLNILMYEINKDIYTEDGDMENGVNSIPIKLGIPMAKKIISILTVIAMLSAAFLYYLRFSESLYMLIYLIVAIWLPYMTYIVAINYKHSKRSLQLNIIRFITVLCLGACILLRHFFTN